MWSKHTDCAGASICVWGVSMDSARAPGQWAGALGRRAVVDDCAVGPHGRDRLKRQANKALPWGHPLLSTRVGQEKGTRERLHTLWRARHCSA
jgi:hypothetical protein